MLSSAVQPYARPRRDEASLSEVPVRLLESINLLPENCLQPAPGREKRYEFHEQALGGRDRFLRLPMQPDPGGAKPPRDRGRRVVVEAWNDNRTPVPS